MKNKLIPCALVALLGLAVTIHAQTPPKAAPAKSAPAKVTLPAAVDAAFKKAYPKATIKNVSEEDGNFEVESMDGAQRRDLIYKPDGTVVEYEEFIAEKDMPAAVMAAIKARYPKATLGQCEKLFKDKTMNYEAAIKGAGSVTGVVLTPDGKWVEPKAAK